MREIETAAERIHLDAVDEDQRVVGLAAARERRSSGARAARSRHRHARHLPQRVGDGRHLPIAQFAAGDDGDGCGARDSGISTCEAETTSVSETC